MLINTDKTYHGIPFSVLDLAPIIEGSTAAKSFKNSAELARHVEKWGFNRYWLAEHHNMPGIASSATSILIGYVANATTTIRVGSGGIMLPNHAILVIAEQFGTLESLFPNRIDLGLGRAPGTDQATAFALRRTLNQGPEEFPRQIVELENYFSDEPIGSVRAIPGQGLNIPIWLLGSSDFSARLAAEKGLPFSFASHFAPQYMMEAIKIYRDNFQPSDTLKKPYVMIGVNIVASNTIDEANFLATSLQQQFINIMRNERTKLQPPVENIENIATPYELDSLERTLSPKTTIVGDLQTIEEKLNELLDETKANELIINSQIYEQEKRLKSYEIISKLLTTGKKE